ncbi:hypothetical protein JCGZ_05262 [Jatropha curcas]|uniref:RING-type E3 ubiquitin transferase n=1 Tax=Jatropha curcas TaxID=180498 RepID=A0A067JLJ7_JATCU|nr:probable E3 ubiquitin-protein ligase RHC1A isoform X1 [Jatropha curcas]XP_012092597.1 probable E3 ubiquitin-protein ligase RHC1A isoform X2 [Jatropha curcas]KDP20379.1 hypothetical protein JCGZ_05262 [Jatropha curcas]
MSSTQRHHQTYWCHECDMSIHLLATAANNPTPFCPHCHRDHLELMDDPTPITATDTNTFFLDSPSFRRFFLPFFADSNPSGDDTTIDSVIPTIKITSSFLDDDPVLLCAVCKDQFVIDVDAKLLPCNHLFHPDCILPWLNSNHDSCPLCRFQLPKPSKNDTSAATTTSESSSNLSSPSHVIEVREPRSFMDCTGSFSRIAMEMGFANQDAADCAFPDVGVLSNFLPSHF